MCILYYCREGFPSERIEAALHKVELATKHQSSNFGLGLITVSCSQAPAFSSLCLIYYVQLSNLSLHFEEKSEKMEIV